MTRLIPMALAGLVLAAPVEALTYTCTLTGQGSNALIPPDAQITLDEATSQVKVWDGFIKAQVGQPIDGQLRSVNANRYLFGWTVPGVKNGTGQYTAGITFSLNISRASGAAQMTSKPQGYGNSWRGSGTCTQK